MNTLSSESSSTVSLVEYEDRPLGVALVNPKNTNKMNDCMDLIALAQQVQTADEFVRANAGSKLSVIAEQMKNLQEQACQILNDAKRDHDLNHVACNVVKKPGTTYHLYCNESTSTRHFSLISPWEWGDKCPHKHLGSYRLELDRSWTPMDWDKNQPLGKDNRAIVESMLGTRLELKES